MEEHTIYSCHELGFEGSELIIITQDRYSNYRAIGQANHLSKYLGRRKKGVALFNVSKSDIEDFEYMLQTKVKPRKRFYIDDMSNNSVSHIESKCRELKENINLSLVVIGNEAAFKESDIEVSERLKKLSEQLEIDIYLMPSFSKEYKHDRPPILDDLENKDLAEFADMVWLVKKDYNKYKLKIYVTKNTHGDTGIFERPPQELINRKKNKKLKEDKLL